MLITETINNLQGQSRTEFTMRGGSLCLNNKQQFLSGIPDCSYATSSTVASITAYASSGVFLPNCE